MTVREFATIDGVSVKEIRLKNPAGAEASVLTWGAILRDLVIPMGGTARRRVVLGFQDFAGYRANPNYLGATVGRNCNRIADGKFTLDGVNYELDVNSTGNVHLHGGHVGFSRRNWSILDHSDASVTLGLISDDGDQHYPGRVEVACQYQLMETATIRVRMTGRTDAPTLLNMAHHSYFTLSPGADIRDHILEIPADFYTPSHPNLIPTGEIRSVAGTAYDFRAPTRIGERNTDYDMNYVLGGAPNTLQSAARVWSPSRDLMLEVRTNEPGLLFYSGFGLGVTEPGIDGQKHGPNLGLCLEAHRYPNAVNYRHFSNAVLRPDQFYLNISEYRFLPAGA